MTVPYTFATATTTLPLSQLDANFSAVGQSANIAYTYNAANAVTRTASAKMSDIVSVKDFGAAGNGIIDDTVAIQAAINYAVSTVGASTGVVGVCLPAGVYKVTSSITVDRINTYAYVMIIQIW